MYMGAWAIWPVCPSFTRTESDSDMSVELKDFSINVKAALNDITQRWLIEAGNEVASQANRNCKLDVEQGGQKLKGSYRPEVDAGKGEAIVGSPLEAVYWEEFGTGSHAAHGDGRKGWWVYVKKGGSRKKASQTYSTQAEAEEAADWLRKVMHLDAYATNGRDPSYTLENAFRQTAPVLIRGLEEKLKQGMSE